MLRCERYIEWLCKSSNGFYANGIKMRDDENDLLKIHSWTRCAAGEWATLCSIIRSRCQSGIINSALTMATTSTMPNWIFRTLIVFNVKGRNTLALLLLWTVLISLFANVGSPSNAKWQFLRSILHYGTILSHFSCSIPATSAVIYAQRLLLTDIIQYSYSYLSRDLGGGILV